MTAVVETVVDEPRWQALDIEALAERAARAVLGHLGLGAGFEIALLACDDARIAELNAGFRGKAGATNVLSWPSEERAAAVPGARPDPPSGDDPELGDIAIAWETCAREAAAAGRPVADHVTHLIVHGVLHLLGFDHETEQDAALMERLEVEILAELGVPDPY